MQGRTWKDIDKEKAAETKDYLIENGGTEEKVKGKYEDWRIKFYDSTLTYYKKGTIYSTPSDSKNPIVFNAWKHINLLVGPTYSPPSKDFLIGLDETGKGEIIGHTVLAGVIIPKEIFNEIDLIIGPADTKKQHPFGYWDDIFVKLDQLRTKGLDFIIEKITPWHVDKYNLNKIMDITYQRILSIFFRKAEINQCRIVLDDYGIGDNLKSFLNFLEKQNAEVIVTVRSDEKYLEAKAASLISKQTREAVINAVNRNKGFQINGLSVGSGNAADRKTLDWLNKWHASGEQWPWFVKKSFKTVRQIDGKAEKVKKLIPPIQENLLSQDFLDEFNKGKLSIQSLSIKCPHCGNILKSATFAIFDQEKQRISKLKCSISECEKFIENAGITLRYYCPYVIPDSSAIRRNIISQDLNASRFFEDFTILLVPVARRECNGTSKGKREFDELRKFKDKGRVKLERIGKVEDLPNDISGTIKDERIIEDCIKYNAILLSGDKSMSSFACGANIFTICI